MLRQPCFPGSLFRCEDVFPEAKAQDKDCDKRSLDGSDGDIASLPSGAACDGCCHDQRACCCADAPAAVEPVHMAGFGVEGDIGIECCIHSPCTQAIGNGPEDELPKRCGRREAEEGKRCERHGSCGEDAGAESADEPVGQKARDDGAEADDAGDDACRRDRCPEGGMHRRPGSAQKAIGQAQAHEGKIDDGQKRRWHRFPSCSDRGCMGQDSG